MVRCLLAVIFVTHKSMMMIPTPTVWTPPWYATIPDSVYTLCLLCYKYDDNLSTIFLNQVRSPHGKKSIINIYFYFVAARPFFKLPNRSWVAPFPFLQLILSVGAEGTRLP